MSAAHQTHRPRSAFEHVHQAFEAAGHHIRSRGPDAFMAGCPLHTDRSPSLSVTWRPTRGGVGAGAVLMHCFSCQASIADLAAAVGLRVADLFDDPAPVPANHPKQHRPAPSTRPALVSGPLPARITGPAEPVDHQWTTVRVYTYTTDRGLPHQQVLRQECGCNGNLHKRFQQRYRDGRRWVYRKPAGFIPVLYRSPALRTAAATDQWIWITEGEKDAESLTCAGCLATTNAQGAANFGDELLAHFDGLKVVIAADRDLAGYRRALDLHARLHRRAAQVVIVLSGLEADKSDASDHIAAGLWQPSEPFGGLTVVSIDELHALALAATAAVAADQCRTALAEARAHRSLPAATTAQARAHARWLAEAARQLRAVHHQHQLLVKAVRQNRSATAEVALLTVTALRTRAAADYRRSATAHPGRKASA